MNQQISSTPTPRAQLHSLFQTFINDILSCNNNQTQSYFLDAKKNFHLPEPNHSLIFPIKGRTPLSRLYLAPELTNKPLNIFSKDQLIKIDVWILAMLAMKKILGQIYKPITSDQNVEDKKRTLKENIFNVKKRYGIEFAELFAKMTSIEPEQRLALPEIQKRLDAISLETENQKEENKPSENASSYTVTIKQTLDVQASGLESYEDSTLQSLMESIKTRQPEKFECIKIHLEGCKLRNSEDTANLAKLITILQQHFESLKTLKINFEDENGANERAVCLSFSLYQNETPNSLKSLSVNLENCREFDFDTMTLLIDFMCISSIDLAELETLELNLHGCQKITDECVHTFLSNIMSKKLINLTINAKKTHCTKGADELCKDFSSLEKINSTVLI